MDNGSARDRALRNALRTARRARDLTQRELADAAGVKWKYIGAIERGECHPTVAKVSQVVEDGLGLSMAAFFERYYEPIRDGRIPG